MNIGFYLGAAAMNALERWQESISSNIASSGSAGFRKREADFSVTPAGGMEQAAGATAPVQFPRSRISVSFQPGQVVGTGRDLDLAIQGDGFFEVQLPDGGRGYTRAGSFYASNERTLVDAMGRPLLGDGGAPIQLLAEGGSLSIARDGTVTQGEQPIGKIAVHRFANPQGLQPLSGGLFRPVDGQAAQLVEQPTLIQGAVETSNVQPVEEMVNLIQVSRAYEAAQKIVTSRDDMLDKTIRTFS